MKIYRSEQYIAKACDVGIFYSKNPNGYVEPLHRHEFIEIIYVMSGHAVEYVDEKEYEVQHGDMLFINYDSVHGFTAAAEFSYYNISFLPEVVSQSLITPDNAFSLLSLTAFEEMRQYQNGGVIPFRGNECAELEHILAAMRNENAEQLPFYDRVMESYMNILITKMLQKTQIGMRQQDTRDIWQELSTYIEQNPGAELTLSALARKCFYNPSYFSRMFKKKFDMSLTEYVNQKRVEYAIHLLQNSEISVDEISILAGFGDRSTFYSVFSKITGKTPSSYRLLVKK